MFPGVWFAVCGVLLGVLASGCGGTERNAHEVKRLYKVEVVHAKFPAKQAIARDVTLAMVVRNASGRTIPDIAVTLDSFYYQSAYPKLAANKRPIWIVNRGPGAIASNPPVQTDEFDPSSGGETTFVNTWALGALAPGASKRFVWHVSPVKAGLHSVRYIVSADLDGRGRAELANGGSPSGNFVALIAPRPPFTHVDPETGRVVAGRNPAAAGTVGAVP